MQNEKTRNEDLDNVLRNLQNICETNLTHPLKSSEGQRHPPALDDLLIELRSRKSIKQNENDLNCYRCKHFLRIPQNFLQEEYDSLSDSASEYGNNVTFVQAIVWLKSAIASMSDIPAEQFHLIFHKRWNIEENGIDEIKRRNVEGSRSRNLDKITENKRLKSNIQESFNPITTKETDQRKDSVNFDSGSRLATSPNLLCNTSHNIKSSKPLERNLQNSAKEVLSSQSDSNDSPTNICPLETIIISESDEECSSCSDMFADSPKRQSIKETFHGKTEEDLLGEERNSVKSQSVQAGRLPELNNVTPDCTSQGDNSTFMETDTPHTKNLIGVDCDESYSTASDVSIFIDKHFCKECQSRSPGNGNSQRPLEFARSMTMKSNYSENLTLSFDNPCSIQSEITNEISVSPGKEVVDKTVNLEDSAYYTYNTYSIDNTDKRMISRKAEEGVRSASSSRQKTQVVLQKLGFDVEIDKNTGNMESMQKRRETWQTTTSIDKHVHIENRASNANKTKRKISSEWLNFMLDTLNTDDIVFRSVKAILSFFKDDIISKRYLKRRCWKDTLEYEAVNAVLNFCEILEAEKKTNELLEEIIERITKMVEKVIEDNELNKITLRMTHLTLLLEFCNSMRICIKVIELLMAKLAFHGNRISTVMEEKQTEIHVLVEQLHLLFYALNICLKKYRLVFSGKEKHEMEENIATAVVDLWKRRFDNSDVTTMEESTERREQRWMTILDDFTVKTGEHFIQFAEKSRSLLNLFIT